MSEQNWTKDAHDNCIVKCGEKVVGIAVDVGNAQRFITAARLEREIDRHG